MAIPTKFARKSGLPLAAILVGGLIFFAGLVTQRYIESTFVLTLASSGLILGILALAIAFMMHQCGLVVFGIAAFYGGAGYLFAIGVSVWKLSPLAAAVAALVISLIYAAAFGALIVRTKPLAFMMLTLAVGEMMRHLTTLAAIRPYTGGADGIIVSFEGSLLGLTAMDFAEPKVYWVIVWCVAWMAVLSLWALQRSYFGAVLRAIKENEERMRFSGFGTFLPRLLAFVLTAGLAALAGIVQTLHSGFVSPELLSLHVSTNALVAALTGGVAGAFGPVIGGVVYTIAQDEFGALGLSQLFTGIAIVLVIVLFPQGLAGAFTALRRRVGG
jgi:branched-chain amino acid transport system permease protein